MKTWIFEETELKNAEWSATFETYDNDIRAEGRLTEYSSNPMEGIRAVYEKWKSHGEYFEKTYFDSQPPFVKELWQAIEAYMKAVGK
jgi:hypothetical protein